MIEWIAIFLVIFGLLVGAAWFFRGQLAGTASGNRDRRIGLVEMTAIDGNRKLLLIYRDGVEHLVMTGGPIDLVIEQNIGLNRRPATDARAPSAPPSFGQGPVANPGAMVGRIGAEAENNSVTGRLRQRLTQPTLDPP